MGRILTAEIMQEMKALTESLQTKAQKIRQLGASGYTRQQIADFLGIRYQHVRNVLVDEERRIKSLMGPPPPDWPADLEFKSAVSPGRTGFEEPSERPPKPPKKTMKVKLGPDGRLAIPSHMLETLGWKEGDTIWVNLEGDGEIRLADVHAVTRRVQAWAKTLNLPSVDEFLAERRREAEREDREMQAWLGEAGSGKQNG